MKIWTVVFGEPCHNVESFSTELLAQKRAIKFINNHLTSYGDFMPQAAELAYKKLVELKQYDIALALYRHFKKNVDIMASDLTGHVME
jgi:hypothetical protein